MKKILMIGLLILTCTSCATVALLGVGAGAGVATVYAVQNKDKIAKAFSKKDEKKEKKERAVESKYSEEVNEAFK
ncbi:hypothetical protein [uncultured Sneathia sp.]|uniref:hypothetical protein n=1 Tax=uncultured Sneathia sp. TaxID=278067 RepID=UPI002592A9E6|nr:hypothetical protein [uncultured Sneathia sp.]